MKVEEWVDIVEMLNNGFVDSTYMNKECWDLYATLGGPYSYVYENGENCIQFMNIDVFNTNNDSMYVDNGDGDDRDITKEEIVEFVETIVRKFMWYFAEYYRFLHKKDGVINNG